MRALLAPKAPPPPVDNLLCTALALLWLAWRQGGADGLSIAVASLVLVTPLIRRQFKDGKVFDDLAPWAQAIRKLAAETNTPLVDLQAVAMRFGARKPPGLVDRAFQRLGLERPAGERARRLVHLAVGRRRAALLVDEVLGLRPLEAAQRQALPPLLSESAAQLDAIDVPRLALPAINDGIDLGSLYELAECLAEQGVR